MADRNKSIKLAVVGGGPGGYGAAFLAADLGMQVTLIDPEKNPGGECLYRGCIPSKALLHVAKVSNDAAEAKEWGVSFSKPRFNAKKIRGWKDDVVEKLTGGLGELARLRKVEHIRGTAKFKNGTTLIISKNDGSTDSMSYDKIILATGSEPAVIPNLDIDLPNLLNSTTALDLESIPKSMLVIGGGYIGLELGTVYATLGTKVSVVEMTPSLLPGVDKDMVSVLSKRLKGMFESIMLNTTVSEMKEQKNGIKASFEGKGAEKKAGIYEKVLMAVGRKPRSEDLGLESTQVEVDDKGFIKVDETRRTNDPNIYAIGDVAGEPMLAHKATHEGRVAAEAIAGHDIIYEPRAIPAVVFTDPEIAWCGLTQTEAKDKGIDVKIVKFPWAASGRALTLGRNDGLTKLVVDPDSERILGVGIAGSGAGELIAEGVLAVEMAATVTDVGMSIHPHPTLSETVMEAADLFHSQSTHYWRPKRKS
ncbi:MAG: dihydrolipoyl dehydrogenase [candidate division Zixibacteria bacterium]|nr:dihydrolipoyl dehydrogenase [candidate division Zixibacteria bacterium]NIR67590.1 dihydrolipoyl dehydrogenase [candidate division Zixibacteria bacterium]NIS16321.1 dihydrolipoyl dehydrogenase [candidate division Zixibacteria bacterium]NIS48851.1 dihydrolipoyl dehydrogenase [candidate division Zixibacteria bacterium]NIT52699.1 dihydrolipoyl dehydrogenase [candidate division Zixibacteria bacterium]